MAEPSPHSPEPSPPSPDDIYELDVSGYQCPFPVLKAAKVMRQLSDHTHLRVISTDAGSWDDFAHFAQESGHRLLQRHKKGDKYVFLLQKAGTE